MSKKIITQCNICGSSSVMKLFKKEANPLFNLPKNMKKVYQLNRCDDCGFIFVFPRPNSKQLLNFYSGQKVFFIGTSDEAVESYLKDKNLYQDKYLKRLQILKDFTSGRNLLEIGSAGGLFLDVAKSRGWKVDGIEPSRWGVKIAKEKLNIKTRLGTIEDLHLPKEYYSVVTFYDVLEHVLNPNTVIRKTRSILKKDGIVAITLPNAGSIWFRLGGKNWTMVSLPEHLNYFSLTNLTKLLENNGFEIVEVKSGTPPGSYLFKSLLRLLVLRIFNKDLLFKVRKNRTSKLDSVYTPAVAKQTNRFTVMIFDVISFPISKIINRLVLGEGLELYARKIN